jgi:hypothetical protein
MNAHLWHGLRLIAPLYHDERCTAFTAVGISRSNSIRRGCSAQKCSGDWGRGSAKYLPWMIRSTMSSVQTRVVPVVSEIALEDGSVYQGKASSSEVQRSPAWQGPLYSRFPSYETRRAEVEPGGPF